jgi:hypothetical protein
MPSDRSSSGDRSAPAAQFVCLLAEDGSAAEPSTNVLARPSLMVVRLRGERDSLNVGFDAIRKASAAAGPLKAVFVVAHGQFSKVMPNTKPDVATFKGYERVSPIEPVSSAVGIGIGFEGIFAHNAHLWSALKGQVQTIIVYGCAAASTPQGMVGTVGDMQRTMGAVAIFSGAHVYAANGSQKAAYDGHDIDFGPWEGDLFEFSPGGAPPRIVRDAPYSLSEV